MADRFYAPLSFEEPIVELSREESQHLATVLRKSPGDAVELFDGHGRSAQGMVEEVSRRRCTVRIVQQSTTALEPSPRIELATAVPKGDRARWLVEKATELGADRWTPLRLTRSVVDPGDGKLERLRQTVISACKQCGRDRLMDIEPAGNWSEWLTRATARGTVMIAHPSGRPAAEVLNAIVDQNAAGPDRAAPESIALAIGP